MSRPVTDPYISAAADEWNAAYPIGVPVLAYPLTRAAEPLYTFTRSAAWSLGHGRPVVLVEGYTGGVYLTHIDATPDGWELTTRSYAGIDGAIDRDSVYAKAYTRYVDGVLTTVGLRIGAKPNHVVAYFGDTVVRNVDRTYSVRRAEDIRRLAVQRHAIDADGMEAYFSTYAAAHPEWCGMGVAA
ncbi:hypothetical protein ACTWP5_27370 [Streptomyces sp. 4N509B]|uniref:hypothetical protein n=1 Tax=Streptomyces sp. 4N509B TaxID=3457413 RepID=UPI003FD3D545